MIHIRDATMLALTKLRTRKVRLIITIAISGLLFSVLAGASFIMRGAISGVSSFSKEGLGSRYIVQGYLQSGFNFMNDPAVIDRALAVQKDIVARKKVAAKDIGITYDPAVETSPIQEFDGPSGTKQRFLNTQHPASQQAISEYLAAHPLPGMEDLKKSAKPYSGSGFYISKPAPYDLGGAQLQVLKNGQETFADPTQGLKTNPAGPSGTDTFIGSWSAMSGDLIKPFMLPGQNLKSGSDGSIPIVIPRTAAEQILGLKALSKSASDEDRLARTKEIRTKAPSVTFTVCYRNNTSSTLLSQAISTKQQIEQNKDNKNFQKPDLIYGLPTQPCGAVPITRDVRSYDEKVEAGKQEQFQRLFGKEIEQEQTLKFRIVGVVADPDYGGAALGVGEIIRSLFTSTLGTGWFMPVDQIDSNPLLNRIFNSSNVFGGSSGFFAEFPTAAEARSFIDKENCSIDYGKLTPNQDPEDVCIAQKKPFSLNPYGSNSLALESASRTFAKFFRLAALAVSVVAAIIMMGTVGRMIADSRRETAVFRAIGAKRFDIAQIYIIYAICLALLTSAFAIAVGLVLAGIADHRWSSQLTVEAINSFNASDFNKSISLYGFYLPDVLLLIGLSVAAGLLSAVFPLLRNLRRNPIRDMRDDT